MDCVCGRTQSRTGRCAECSHSGRVKRFELAVRGVLEDNELTKGFVWNQPVRGTRFRPDFAWYFQNACVTLEVDENEHAAYDADAEHERELEITRALGRPVHAMRLRIKKSATVESVVRVAESLVPTLACRIAEAQDRKKNRRG